MHCSRIVTAQHFDTVFFISSPKTGIYCLIIFLPNNSIINAQKMPRSYSGAFTAGEGAHCLQEVFLHNVEGVAFWQVL